MLPRACLLLVPALLCCCCCWRTEAAHTVVGGSSYFPEGFSGADFSQYTVRYVSESGEDSEACLQSQPYTEPSREERCLQEDSLPATITPCRSIGHSLLEYCNFINHTDCTARVTSNLMILIYPGVYEYAENYSIIVSNYTNLIIRKLPLCEDDRKVMLSCAKLTEELYNNLYVISSANLAIDGITFSRCGPKSPGAAMFDVHDATITNCNFRNNLNSGYVAYTVFNTTFLNCTFRDNNSTFVYDETESLSPGDYRFAGGLTLTWRDQRYQPVTVLIKNCTFVNNTASINTRNANDTNRPNFYIPRGHGGAIVASFNRTHNHTVLIEDTIMVDNEAKFNGGGVFLSFYNSSNFNKFIIRRSRIDRNRCANAGGGISMNTFEVANFNHLVVEDTNFTGNIAWVGGGACTINHQDNRIPDSGNPEQPIDNVGYFRNCVFQRNSSPTGGSTVSMVSNARVDQVSIPTNFIDCQFLYNEGKLSSDGAVMGFRFPFLLAGTSVFRGNTGGGGALLQSRMYAYGDILFEDNISENGGGMDLQDYSVILLFNGTNMTFINNSAVHDDKDFARLHTSMGVGGAISVLSPSVGIDSDIIRLFNTRCFLQYEVGVLSAVLQPSEWNVHLNFINNTADNDGGAVYLTDLERCTYAPSVPTAGTNNSFQRSIFSVPIFNFEGNQVRRSGRNEQNVATAPSRLIVEPETIEGAPGEVITFRISAVDESDNWQSAIWNINEDNQMSSSQNYFSLREGFHFFEYKICERSKDSCSVNTETSLRFSLVQVIAGSVSNMTEVKVRIRDCYPGYYLSDNECLIKNSSQILRPDRANHYIYIQPQFYAAHNQTEDKPDEIVYVIIPIPFQYCKKTESNLAGCLFQYDQPDQQCSEGREGFLCGTCIQNENGSRRGVDLTLIQCADCNLRDTLLVAFIVVLFVVGCALVLIFNIGIPNEMRGCLFFIQVVGFVYQYRSGDQNATWDFHLSRVFSSSLYLPLCPLPGTNALYTSSYGLLLPALAIITIVVYIISARFIKHLSNKNSFEGIWFLTFIIYKFIADTCFSILRCQKVVRDDGVIHSEFVYYYDGAFKCFTTNDLEHLCFAIIALFLGVLVILFPALILLISFKRYKMTQQLTDVLNNDLKISCRWWGSFDLFRRLLFVLVVLIFNYILPPYSQLALLFAGLLVFFTFAFTQPYNSRRANIIETLVQLDLIVLTALFLDTTSQHQDAVRPFGYILLLIPFISMILYISAMLLSCMWTKLCPLSVKMFCSKFKLKTGRRLGLELLITHEEEKETLRSREGSFTSTVNSTMEGTVELYADYSEFREELLDD